MSLLIDPQLNEYMTDVTLNNYLPQGIVITVTHVDEFLVSRPINIAPGKPIT